MSAFRLAAALLLALAGCADPPPPAVDRIEIGVSGWEGLDIAVNRDGSGSFHLSEPMPTGKSGAFAMTSNQFQRLIERLEPYRRQSVPVTKASALDFISRGCPRSVPFATDSGGVYIHWIGPNLDRHFLADLGCDHLRQAKRNEDLLGLVRSLPVPADW